MLTTLKEITLTLENCEEITIPGYYVGAFLAEDMRETIRCVAGNAICRYTVCHEFKIELHRDANKQPYTVFGKTPDPDSPYSKTIFDRLQIPDITAIDIVMTDNDDWAPEFCEHTETLHYLLIWNEDSDYDNTYQTSVLSPAGDLLLVVSSGGQTAQQLLDEIYPAELKEVFEEDRDLRFSMYNIGDQYHQELIDLIHSSATTESV